MGVAPDDFSHSRSPRDFPPISRGFITYDNLFWPGEASATAFNIPGAGALLDIYGLMFTIGSGTAVDLFSNGVGFGHGGLFGVVIATSDAALDTSFRRFRCRRLSLQPGR